VSAAGGEFSIDAYTCGVRADGTAACWGDNSYGQSTPPAGTFVSVNAGDHTCGVRTDGTIACWGQNAADATLPAGTFTSVSWPCGLRTDGTIACWGRDNFGQNTPPPGVFVAISSSQFGYTCALDAAGVTTCWGSRRTAP
jgi:alpha-tubulin suppressor-like RCC1 family protein